MAHPRLRGPEGRDLRAEFEREGYLVLEGFASAEEVAALRRRAGELVEAFEPEAHSVFSTKNQESTSNDYFLESANGIHFFFEEEAHDGAGRLKQAKHLSINKFGHAVHDLDPVFRRFSRSAKVAELLRTLGQERPLPMQSMYIFKQPGIGGEVVPHQDSTFLRTDPPSVIGLWWALEDATKENGCLWALPGSHKAGVARRMYVDQGTVKFDKEPQEHGLEGYVPLEVPAGALVVLHGAVLHMSYENRSPRSRHAYSMHVIEGKEGVLWRPDNWLQRSVPPEPLLPSSAEGLGGS